MELPKTYKSSMPQGRLTRSVLADATSQNVSTGLISATLIMTGPAMIILEAAAYGGLTDQQTVNWMFAVNFFGGLFGVMMAMRNRLPITGGHSLTGIAFLAAITAQFTYPQLIGGFLMSGLLIFLLGISGLFTRIIKWVPKEVISAMLAGLVASFVVRLIPAVKEMPIIGGTALISYFILIKFSKQLPPALGAIVVAILMLLGTQGLEMKEEISAAPFPTFQSPEFTWMGLISLAIPLAMLILSNDAAPGVGALESMGYRPPIRKIVSASGLFSMITAFFGGQCANIAGMMTAICSSPDSGPKSKRYVASILSGIGMMIFGLFSWKIVPFIQSLPHPLISILTGFSLIGVLLSNLKLGFSGRNYSMSSLTAFVIALSNVSFFHISAPVWALLFGAAIAATLEKNIET
ncbi:benzoate/H(+) symporter BenE family transporter [Ammoniphilus sp. 3BR4]|uniref:benzoate/H(+) symporter BenE family transporter n=1 Tax=Ammoniphilus sp. 3BR4 TaxID=3158265 RepID=UPI0034661971